MYFKNWCLSFLNIYKYIETIANSIDKLVEKEVRGSSFNSRTTTYEVANKLIEYTERKKNLINLKVIIADAMSKMRPIDVKILVLYYKDGMKSNQIAEILDMGQRTFFRKKSLAIESFCKCVKNLGYTSEYFMEKFSKECWLMNIYEDIQCKNSPEITLFEDKLREYKFLKNLTGDLSKVNCFGFNVYNSLSS